MSLLQALEKADTEGVVPYYIVLICYILYAIPMVVVSVLRWCDRLLKRSAGSSKDVSDAVISAGGGGTGRDSAAAHVGSRSPAARSRFAAASGDDAVGRRRQRPPTLRWQLSATAASLALCKRHRRPSAPGVTVDISQAGFGKHLHPANTVKIAASW